MRAGADGHTAQRAHDLVLSTKDATQHDAPAAPGSSADARLLVDIDLSILVRPAERFERDDQDVRKEYAWVPGLRCEEARAQVLLGLMDRPRLHHGEHAVSLLKTQARIKLAAAFTSKLRRLAQ